MDAHTVAFLLIDVAVVIAAARIGGRIAQAFRQPRSSVRSRPESRWAPACSGCCPETRPRRCSPPRCNRCSRARPDRLVLFMFIVGLELDMRLVAGRERAAATISVCSIVVPFALGVGLAVVLYPTNKVVGGKEIGLTGMALFLGIAMSITAFPVLARILTDRGMQRTPPGVFSLAAAAVDDIIAWTALAFVIAVISGGSPLASRASSV